MNDRNPWKTLSSKILLKNPWFSVREDAVVRIGDRDGIVARSEAGEEWLRLRWVTAQAIHIRRRSTGNIIDPDFAIRSAEAGNIDNRIRAGDGGRFGDHKVGEDK